jgi:hypothetical protein
LWNGRLPTESKIKTIPGVSNKSAKVIRRLLEQLVIEATEEEQEVSTLYILKQVATALGRTVSKACDGVYVMDTDNFTEPTLVAKIEKGSISVTSIFSACL